MNPGAWTKMLADAEANFLKRVQDERATTSAAR
jgi:hypothetical protein